MCGIVGLMSRLRVDAHTLKRAIAALRHRGPDGDGSFVNREATVGLGHRRLAIIDLSPAGRQPMQSPDGRVVLTFNGEIYNYRELRQELIRQGYRFRSESDTEVLLTAYLAYGSNLLPRLNGIFAFAIYDTRDRSLFLARDQMGVKPLYYSETPDAFVFASEIKALLELADCPREVDASAIRRYLTFLWCPGEQTPLKHVKKLGPGSALVVRGGKVTRRWQYWQPPKYSPWRGRSSAECAAELKTLIDRCVSRQMVSDAPLGAFLSGGIDSSAIVASARLQNPEIQCFTINLSGGAEAGTEDDLPHARRVAAHLGVQLTEVEVNASTMCDRVVDMVEMLDEPLADPACLNVLFISEIARSHGIKVLLSGVGGDDLFSGYRRHTLLAFTGLLDRLPLAVRRASAKLAGGVDRRHGRTRRMARLLELAAESEDRRIVSAFTWGPEGGADSLLSADVRRSLLDEDVAGPLHDLLRSAEPLSSLEKCLMLERRFFLADHNLIYTDKMAMAAGVEVRVPFLDLDLVSFASTVPTEWKHRGLTAKWILKKSQDGVLPDEILHRPKAGFGAPLRRWINQGMEELIGDLLSPATVKRRGLFDPVTVQKMVDQQREGRGDATYTLFSLMCVELWCRRFLDAKVQPDVEFGAIG